MNRIRTFIAIASFLTLSLIIAACDDSASDDSDDSADVDSPETTEEVSEPDEESTDEVVVEEDEASDDAADEEATTEDEDEEGSADESDAADDAAESEDSTDDATTDDEDDGSNGEQDAQQILDDAADRAAELETAKFTLDGSGQINLEEIGEISLSEAEGQVERPDSAQISVEVDAAIADVPVEILSVDGQVYINNPVDGGWHEAPEDFQFNPNVMFSEDEGLPALIRSVEDPELLETEEIDGREAYKIYGIISQETINAGTAGVFQAESDVDFNVWIDTETHDVLRVLAEDPTEETDSVWEMMIFEHDEPVEIDDPSDEDDS